MNRFSQTIQWQPFILAIFTLLATSPAHAAGTYSEGWAMAKLVQFESRGIFFESYEGIMEWTSFDEDEECNNAEDQCFKPTTERIEVSVRPESAETVNFLRKHMNQDILIRLRIHRFEPVALETDFEVVEAALPEVSAGLPDKFTVKKTGGKRNFSVQGKILRLTYEGTVSGTYEGLYHNKVTGLVHPFSVTEEEMAEHIWKVIRQGGNCFLGISQAYVTGTRKSDFDVFEINLKEAAGAVEVEPAVEEKEESSENKSEDSSNSEGNY